jgi:diguanylate cyclase (GGDEF)-like protein
MLHPVRSGSIRTWIGIGMVVALSPLLLSAITGYLILNRDVIPLLQKTSSRQHDQIDPTQRLRLLIWSSVTPVAGFAEEGNAAQKRTYKAIQGKIEEAFTVLQPRMRRDPELSALVDKARQDWIAADSFASAIVDARRGPPDRKLAGFHKRIVAADEKLAAAYEKLTKDSPENQERTVDLFNRFETVGFASVAVSLLAFFVLFIVIGQIRSGSAKRLVEGAQRFASGDKEKIAVRVPPDLHGVLEELNRSIARAHESEYALANRANRDGLTELLNRRAFDDTFAALFARKERFGERFALVLMDLDHFKSINDSYGHSAGDEVLRVTAARMMTDLRPFDQVFRVGGEEFAVLLSGADSPAARQIANRLLQAIASHPIPIPSGELSVTASIGVVTDLAGSDPTTLYEAADAALYHAKTTGRNRVVVGERAYTSAPEESAAL